MFNFTAINQEKISPRIKSNVTFFKPIDSTKKSLVEDRSDSDDVLTEICGDDRRKSTASFDANKFLGTDFTSLNIDEKIGYLACELSIYYFYY